ncbi:MAG: regulatory iron-sulfur-containing complex subunit RicT [Lentisphaeria bacterium]
MKQLYEINVAPGIHYPCLADEALQLKPGTDVVLKCERYEEFGRVLRLRGAAEGADVAESDVEEAGEAAADKGRRIQGLSTPTVLRPATAADQSRFHENETRSRSLLRTAMLKIHEHRLPMKVVHLHMVLDGSLLVIQFTAETRVDFRELLRDLSRLLHARVELRQIGVRDETSIHGGIGPCGRAYCCATFLSQFRSINVRTAKEQGLSLNPVNISGVCGRLKCCLRYESDGYRQMLQEMPRMGAICDTPDGPGKVCDVMPLARRVRILLQPGAGQGGFRDYPVADVKVRPPPPRPAPAARRPNEPPPAGPGRNG